MTRSSLFASTSQTFAPFPVWSGSIAGPVIWQPLTKKAAVRIYQAARAWDRATDRPGCHGGIIGRTALEVLETLLFEFLNFASGRLDPSKKAIAGKAGLCERAVATALDRLRRLGIVSWIRRCAAELRDGRFCLEQQTNAYHVAGQTAWRGYQPPAQAPVPQAGTWGDPPRRLDGLAQAHADAPPGAAPAALLRALEAQPDDIIAAALARLQRAILQ